ncbi:MAG TPA: helicase-associated domain-containing protein, partial [Nocardioidaceae bacterium]|nr:helicase-associated domain-containing protein [Nocardioidaceae bacterium]
MSSSAPRTLADQLRSWPDDALVALLSARPDLATPTPHDTAQLASRAGSRASVLRVADGLNLLELAVVDALVAHGGTASLAELQSLVNADPQAVGDAAERLVALALVWGQPDALRCLSTVADALGTPISGLLATLGGPPGSLDPEKVPDLVAQLNPEAAKVLDHLERTNATGTIGSAESAVAPLLELGLLVRREKDQVVVPREVAIALRGGRTTRERVDIAPTLATSDRDAALVDRAAAGAAFEVVRHVELLLEHWGTHPPAALRGGGLGVRDLKAASVLMHVNERVAALLVETTLAAGLLAVGHTDEVDAAWLPTETFDHWLAAPVADRWTRLALAWLGNPRLTGLVGSRQQGKTVNALAPELERSWLEATRREALAELAAMPSGRVLAVGTGLASLVERLRWLRPRRPATRAEAVAWTIEEASALGVLALGGMSSHGRVLVESSDPGHQAPHALQPLLPEPVTHVMVQADLTAVAPGPLEQELARNLATLADVESRGGATVYRFNERSVRRAFDSGWSLAEVHAFLNASSATEIPQPLRYLVDDVSRKFGTVRVGAAESFLRSDDEVALAELVHDPRTASLRLRRIAPTVVVSDIPVDVLLPRLRDLGVAPVVEAPDGTVRLARKEAFRARVPASRARPAEAARTSARVAAVVTAVRAGDRAEANRPPDADRAGLRRTAPVSLLAQLRE